MTLSPSRRAAIDAALLMLISLQGIMLASLFFDVAPHPPRAIPLFAMAPFLAVAIGVAFAARAMLDEAAGPVLAILAALCALLSFGPQKYLDPALPEIWVAVVAAQLSALTIFVQLLRGRMAA